LVDRIFGILNLNISKIFFFVKHSKVKIFELDLPANRKPNQEKELNLLSLNKLIQNLTKKSSVLLERCKVCDHYNGFILFERYKGFVLFGRIEQNLVPLK
jgi:hypothetical protein